MTSGSVGELLIVGVMIISGLIWYIADAWEHKEERNYKTCDIQRRYEYLLDMYNNTNSKSTKANLAHDLSLLEDEATILGITLREQTIKITGVESCAKPSFWQAVKHLFCKKTVQISDYSVEFL